MNIERKSKYQLSQPHESIYTSSPYFIEVDFKNDDRNLPGNECIQLNNIRNNNSNVVKSIELKSLENFEQNPDNCNVAQVDDEQENQTATDKKKNSSQQTTTNQKTKSKTKNSQYNSSNRNTNIDEYYAESMCDNCMFFNCGGCDCDCNCDD